MLAAGVAGWARLGAGPARPVPVSTPPVDEEEEEPAPVEEAPAPPRPETPEEFGARILRTLAESASQPPEAREAAVSAMIDFSSLSPAAFGEAWGLFSAEQRAVATRDLRALLVAQTLQGARAWLPLAPHLTAVHEDGTKARVETHALREREDIDVQLHVARRRDAGGLAVVDVEVEGVSTVRALQREFERVLAKNDRDLDYLLTRLARKVARLRAEAAAP